MRSVSVFAIVGMALGLGGEHGSAQAEEEKGDLAYLTIARFNPADRFTVIGKRQGRTSVPGAASFIGEEELDTFEYQDILRILRLAPGVNVQQEDGFGLRPNIGLRGTTVERSEQITLMEDGVLIAPAPYAAPAAYYFPTAGRLEGVEVVKGAAAIRFGPRTTGGAINLLSRSIPQEPGGFLQTRFGERDMFTVHGAYGGTVHVDKGLIQNLGLLVETHQSRSDGFKRLPNGDDVGGFDIEDYLVKLRADTGNAAEVFQSLQLKFGYADNDSGSSYLGLTDEDFAADPYQRYAASALDEITTEHWQAQLNHHAEFSEAFSLTTVAYYNDFTRDWFKLDDLDFGEGRFSPVLLFGPVQGFQDELTDLRGTPVSLADAIVERDRVLDTLRGNLDSIDDALQLRHNDRSYYSTGVQTLASIKFQTGALDHGLDLSVRYHEDRESRLQNRENFRIENGALVPTSVDPVGSQGNRVAKAQAWSFYAQDTLHYGKWRFTPGLRVEVIDLRRIDFSRNDPDRSEGETGRRDNRLTTISPGIGVFYELSDDLTLLAGVHKGVNPPGTGTPEAKEEESLNLEAGFLFEDNGLRFEAIGFYNDVSDLLGTCSASRGCIEADIGDQFNVGSVHTLGLEIDAAYDYATGINGLIVPLRFNYTFTDAEFREAIDSPVFGATSRGDALPNIPRHQFTARAGLETSQWSLSLLGNFTGDRRSQTGQGQIPEIFRVESRFLVDLAADYRLTDGVCLFFEVRNLFDKQYAVARRPYGLRPGLPQTVLGGIQVDF